MELCQSGGQALAPLRAARGDNPATAWGGHARTKAVAAFANKPARLVSAFHGTSPTTICCLSGGRYIRARPRRVNQPVSGSRVSGVPVSGAVAKRGRRVSDDTMAVITDTADADAAGQRRASSQRALRPGSDDHKTAFCRMLLDTHNPYQPASIIWPPLDPAARDRLVALP